MRAARYYGPRNIQVENVNVPEPAHDEVLVDIEWCGICGTDLHEYLIGPVIIPTREKPSGIKGAYLPVIMGHEFCGKISKAPPSSGLKIGQPVMVDPRIYCKSCYTCQSSNTNICTQWGFLGLGADFGGGLAESIAVRPEMCYPLPDSVSLADAAVIEPLVVGRHAIKCSGFDDFSLLSALVIGGGPVGVAVIHNLRAKGSKQIFVSEPTQRRHAHVSQIADAVFDPTKLDVGEKCRSLTNGKGVDVVFDCAGVNAGLQQGMDSLRRRGTMVNVAAWETKPILPYEEFMLKELNYKAAMSYDDLDFQETVADYLAGKFKGAETMITSRISLEDVVSKGFDELVNNKDDHVKILVTPQK
ncbi:hypothetical protein H2204_005297 [Knufia peltigerae]|uniref:Uncharacterized protein n=1 Tax=Knufia peltigerae TaxID=1002370 RepID=A0AA39CYL5_9EURO|nr:hypothetical protein H2204_005297 [Knufia peltigerae]